MIILGVCVLVAVLLIMVFLPRLPDERVRARQSVCASNLKNIGMALTSYMAESNGSFPTTWKLLVPHNAYLKQVHFQCPRANPKTSSYVGITHDKPITRPSEIPVMCELLGNHKMQGANVLFADGHVEWVAPDRYKKLLPPYIYLEAE